MARQDIAGPRPLPLPEFVAMLALLFATVAFSIDAMLPALPQIAADLSPSDPNRAQLVLASFIMGMGIGTLFTGPISDAAGRKVTIFGGFALYSVGALMASMASSLDMLMLARVVQGLGVAAPRVVGIALVRDLYSGREMARITSLAMMIFILVPAVAPAIGALIADLAGWRGIFLAFVAFAILCCTWVGIRQDETLPRDKRRALSFPTLLSGTREVLSDRNVVIYTVVLTLGMGQMFALLASSQQIFGETFGQAENFPKWFALQALIAGTGSFLNARLVIGLGMRRLAGLAYLAQVVLALGMTLVFSLNLAGDTAFWAFFGWSVSIFFMAGLTFGNLQALAMQRTGHIAGLTASLVTALATVGSVLIAAPVGLAFDGTPVPVMAGAAICSALAWVLLRAVRDR
ncbi:MAG: hypothetical protein RLZZ528_263 [Pseudomonadota bacterium]